MSRYEGGLVLRDENDEAQSAVKVACHGNAAVHLTSSVFSHAGSTTTGVMLSAGEAREIAFALKAAADAAEGREPLKAVPIKGEVA